MKTICLATLCLLAAVVPSLGDGMKMSMPHRAPMSPAEAANATAMRGMMKEMNGTPSGDADKDFARMMLAHHRGAIAMAKVELDFGKDTAMRALASSIIQAQEAEITLMQGWLDTH